MGIEKTVLNETSKERLDFLLNRFLSKSDSRRDRPAKKEYARDFINAYYVHSHLHYDLSKYYLKFDEVIDWYKKTR